LLLDHHMFFEICGEEKQKTFVVGYIAIFFKGLSENMIEVFGYWRDVYMTDVDFLVSVTFGELEQINKGVIVIEGGYFRLDQLRMLHCPEPIVGIRELLDMTPEAVVRELKSMQLLTVVLLENAERVAQVFSISLGEEIGDIVLAFRAYLLGMLTH
jgi:hypothetical protein